MKKEDVAFLYEEATHFETPIIPWWKIPFLWFLWFFIGYTTELENLKMYWLDFRGIKYLLESKKL